jgi:hypothetical protein
LPDLLQQKLHLAFKLGLRERQEMIIEEPIFI